MPPDRELAPAFSHHLPADTIPFHGPARVLLGRSGEAVSPLDAPAGINYLDVHLKARQRWTHQPPLGHQIGWIAVMDGGLRCPDALGKSELVVFDASDAAITFEATADSASSWGRPSRIRTIRT